MNKIKLIIAGIVALTAVSVGVATTQDVSAQAANCHVNVITPVSGLSDFGSNITTSGKTATAKFKVTGDANCKKTMTFASWKLPNKSGLPLEAQKLYTSTTRTYGVGTQTISVRLPDCYWQVDLLEGSRATSVNGNANYVWGKDRLMDFELGGDKSCDPPKEEKCPHDSSMKKDDPNCERCPWNPEMPANDKENCKPPAETPETPETPLTPVVEKMPSTGAGSLIASTLGLSSTVGLAYNYIRSRKQLR